MSIQDSNGDNIVVLNTLHAWAFKALIWIGMIATPAGMSLLWRYGRSIDNHELRINYLERSINQRSGVSQSVNVGQTDSTKMASDHRDWLTVQEVADREGVTDRTILNYIEAKRISPTPTKDGREWRIAENFRILPNSSEEFGIAETQHIATP